MSLAHIPLIRLFESRGVRRQEKTGPETDAEVRVPYTGNRRRKVGKHVPRIALTSMGGWRGASFGVRTEPWGLVEGCFKD